jgi:hypothetical protein
MCLKCPTIFSSDRDFLKRKSQLGIKDVEFSRPVPNSPELDLRPEGKPDGKDKAAKPESLNLPRSSLEHPEGEAGAEDTAND